MIVDRCEECGATIEAPDRDALGDAWVAHVRSVHADWPFPDVAIRNYADAGERLTGPTERLDTIGDVVIHPVTEDRLDDWLAFFDHDAFADNRAWAACYCFEPHGHPKGVPPEEAENHGWRDNREAMIDLLRSGKSFGYLAYVDGRPAGWVNASKRSEYALYRMGEGADPADTDVVGVSCFVIAPPYRRHGLAAKLLDRVVADAAGRGAEWVEAYPSKAPRPDDASHFRGPRALLDEFGFDPVAEEERHLVVRKPV